MGIGSLLVRIFCETEILGQTFMRKFYTSFYLDAKKIFVGHYQNEAKSNNSNNEKPDKKFPITEKGHHKEVLDKLFANQ
jgi:hypothetical protein